MNYDPTVVKVYERRKTTYSIGKPPLCPDLITGDFFLFSKLKLPLRGIYFMSIKDIKQNSWKTCKPLQKRADSLTYLLHLIGNTSKVTKYILVNNCRLIYNFSVQFLLT